MKTNHTHIVVFFCIEKKRKETLLLVHVYFVCLYVFWKKKNIKRNIEFIFRSERRKRDNIRSMFPCLNLMECMRDSQTVGCLFFPLGRIDEGQVNDWCLTVSLLFLFLTLIKDMKVKIFMFIWTVDVTFFLFFELVMYIIILGTKKK
jgi:hypothetical protein